MTNILDTLEKDGQQTPKVYNAEKPLVLKIHETLTADCEFRINEVKGMIEFKKHDSLTWEKLEEQDLNSLWIDFQLNGDFGSREKPSVAKIYTLLNSRFTKKFNAIKSYFNDLEWDGHDYFTDYCKLYTIDDVTLDNGLHLKDIWQDLFKQWLISACACMLGVSPNHVMFLIAGGQGIGKTTQLNNLCPSWLNLEYRFTGHIKPDLTDNNTANLLAEKAWLNIDDQLEKIFDKDFNALKSLITIDKLNNRKAYDRFEKTRKRIANFVGSINEENIFVDTQNRRWLTIKVTDIDYKTNFNIDQLWAQIYTLYKGGARYYFNAQQNILLNAINDFFAKVPPEQEYFMICYEPATETDIEAKYLQHSEILSTLNLASGLKMRAHFLTATLKKMGIAKTSKRVNGGIPLKVYCLKELFIKDAIGKVQFKLPITNTTPTSFQLQSPVQKGFFQD
jgi:predicted P-loop ATPase